MIFKEVGAYSYMSLDDKLNPHDGGIIDTIDSFYCKTAKLIGSAVEEWTGISKVTHTTHKTHERILAKTCVKTSVCTRHSVQEQSLHR